MVLFIPGGPERFAHQRRGLAKMISTGGVTAILYDPGMGKTAIVLDYASLLALKSPTGEARVLIVCPLVAVDTWVTQTTIFASPQIGYWAEALGGSLLQRAEALASRGGSPYKEGLVRTRPKPPKGWILTRDDVLDERGPFEAQCLRCSAHRIAKRASTVDRWWQQHLEEVHPTWRPRSAHGPRALHHNRALAWSARQLDTSGSPQGELSSAQGPEAVATPRLVLEVINIDTLASRAQYGPKTLADVMLGAVERFAPDMVVVDESHKIKSPSGNASQLLARVAKRVRRRVILTGTVAPAGPLDVFAQWRFLEPYAFGDVASDGTRREATYGGFQRRYVVYGGWGHKEIKGYVNIDDMQHVMSSNAVVGRKSDELGLPRTTEVELPVNLSPAEASAYREMKNKLATQLSNGAFASVPNRLVQMLRLRQITSGHLPEDNGPVQVIGTSKAKVICSLIQDTLIGEKRIVVFCLFSHEIRMLTTLLRKDPATEVMVIEGSTPAAGRQAMRERFGSDDPARIVLVAQIKTISLAVNELVTANHAVFASLSQQRDDIQQAMARLDRTGQTRPVTFWICLAPRTVDEIIWKSHKDRTDLEDALLRHVADAD